MRAPLIALLACVACTEPTPDPAPSENMAASNALEAPGAAASPANESSRAPDPATVAAPAPPDADAPVNRSGDYADACGASKLQGLVGKPRSEIPGDVAGRARVACTECPITMDFNLRRINIFYDEKTGLIMEVRCG